MSEKQDRTYPRTAAELERKYNFGRNFSEILGVAKDAQTHAYNAEASVKEWSQRIVGLEGNYAEIKAEQDRISLLVQDFEGDYSEITQTVDGISLRVAGLEGSYSEIIQTQESITAKVGDLEGDYSKLTQTVDGISAEVVSLDGEFSKMEQTVDGITTKVGTLEGNYSSIEQTANDITLRVGTVEEKHSELEDEIDGISKEIATVKNTYSTIEQTDSKISLSVTNLEEKYDGELTEIKNNYSTIEQTDKKIATSVTSIEEKYDGELTEIKNNYSTIEQTDKKIATSVTSIEEKYDGELKTIRETYSTIEQTSEAIEMAVWVADDELRTDIYAELALRVTTDTNGNLQSRLYIGANRLTIDTDNFTLTEDGTIGATAGNIAGWTLSDEGMYDSSVAQDSTGICRNGAGPAFWAGASVNNKDNAKFRVYHHGELHAIGATIEGIFSAISTGFGSTYMNSDGLTIGTSSTHASIRIGNQTISWRSAGSDGQKASISCENGGNMRINPYGTGTLAGTWKCDTWQGSDRKLKYDIENLNNCYDVLFDSLIPRRFKYIDGTSNRFHTGFVFDEIQAALNTADLSEKDLAAILTTNPNTEAEESGVRYVEFVALNTWQIQKLKKRVSELEVIIAKLQKI